MDDLEIKAIGPLTVSDVEQGEVTAIVNTLNVVDRDGDVILPGAIPNGITVKLSAYQHDVITQGNAPAGKGVISIEGDHAVFRGKYFLGTARGRDAFEMVKALGEDSEWSIGYHKAVKTAPMTEVWRAKGAKRLIAGLSCKEVSPVFMGANGLTGTIATKAADAAALAAEEEAAAARRAEEEAATAALATAQAERKAIEQKALVNAAHADFLRIQRTFKRLGLTG